MLIYDDYIHNVELRVFVVVIIVCDCKVTGDGEFWLYIHTGLALYTMHRRLILRLE